MPLILAFLLVGEIHSSLSIRLRFLFDWDFILPLLFIFITNLLSDRFGFSTKKKPFFCAKKNVWSKFFGLEYNYARIIIFIVAPNNAVIFMFFRLFITEARNSDERNVV